LFSKEQYVGMKNNEEYDWKCKKCGFIFTTHRHTTSYFRRMSKFPLCPYCFPPMTTSSFL
jgi:hypothetical protein